MNLWLIGFVFKAFFWELEQNACFLLAQRFAGEMINQVLLYDFE